MKKAWLFFFVGISAIAAIMLLLYALIVSRSQDTLEEVVDQPVTETPGNGNISQEQISTGWYWGTAEQKLLGTPSDWIYKDAGRSSCWHEPGIDCF